MFKRRTLFFGVGALALFALTVTAGKGGASKPPPPPPPPADPAILYESASDGGFEGGIWVMNADATNQTPVITLAADGIQPSQGTQSWSGDNTRFAFVGYEDETAGVYVSDIAGLYPRRIHTLINSGDPVSVRPDWCPTPLPEQPAGEEWIVFGDGPLHEVPWHLYAIALRSDGTTRGPFNLTSGLGGNWRGEPTVSFDGTLIAYQQRDAENFYPQHIYVGTVGKDGDGNPVITGEVSLTGALGGNWMWPAFDPSGRYVVADRGNLWIIPVDNPAVAWELPVTEGGSVHCPTWLDEQTVVFERGQNKPQLWDLRTVDIVTLEVTILASSKQVSRRRPAARR